MAFAPPISALDEITEFLALSPTAEQIVAYEPPVQLQQHLSELLDNNRRGRLSDMERHELDEFVQVDRFMSRLKLKARKHLKS